METKQIVNWLRDKADRADSPSWTRMMHTAADHLLRLEYRLEQACAERDAVTKRMIELEQKQRWIPVAERLPEYGQEVIVYSGNVLKPVVYGVHYWNKEFNSWAHITHWMPLPEPPKEDEDA